MKKEDFNKLSKRSKVFVARDNLIVKKGIVFTKLGLHDYIMKVGLYEKENPMFIKINFKGNYNKSINYVEKILLEAVDVGNGGDSNRMAYGRADVEYMRL